MLKLGLRVSIVEEVKWPWRNNSHSQVAIFTTSRNNSHLAIFTTSRNNRHFVYNNTEGNRLQ